MRQGMLTLSGAPSTTSHFGYNTSFHLDYNILSNLHYLGSPLGYCTLIFDLMRNIYIYKACIYIYSSIFLQHHRPQIKYHPARWENFSVTDQASRYLCSYTKCY